MGLRAALGGGSGTQGGQRSMLPPGWTRQCEQRPGEPAVQKPCDLQNSEVASRAGSARTQQRFLLSRACLVSGATSTCTPGVGRVPE